MSDIQILIMMLDVVDNPTFLMSSRAKIAGGVVFTCTALALTLGGNLASFLGPATLTLTTLTYHRMRLKLIEDTARVKKSTMVRQYSYNEL